MLLLLAQDASYPSMNINSDQFFVLVIIAIGCLTALLITVFSICAGMASSLHRSRMENDLKREMLDRGMTADEIETVIKASKPTDFLERMADRRRR
ncbi:hypothetical protein KOR34_29280 [Posidoniimonas corsicana]|uniref:Uncharacterized protein n=1 Tax=Posidoniimonas corsicana TaxID=1938618 RepID=A0A5C5VJS4_9BACT|nr:hypothetical protein [Posidoniimonas corsicana]TWT37962.1 hypothetical protein KOR34_29280 [Posidoniimonas corsicana]